MQEIRQKLTYLQALLAAEPTAEDPHASTLPADALVETLVMLAQKAEQIEQRVEAIEAELDKIDADLTDLEDLAYGGQDTTPAEQPLMVDAMCVHCKKSTQLAYDQLDTQQTQCPYCKKNMFIP